MIELKFHQILQKNNELGKSLDGSNPYKILVLTNCVVSQIKEILEYSLRKIGIYAVVQIGNYDNIIQDSNNKGDFNLVLVFWEVFNLVNGFYYKVLLNTDEYIAELIQKTKSEINYVVNSLKQKPLVIFNEFQCIFFKNKSLDVISLKLNEFLKSIAPENFILFDLKEVFLEISLSNSIHWQNFYINNMPYSIEFLKSYAGTISKIVRTIQGKSKKVLILDCDNTLWKGIIGEDGIDGINLSGYNKIGCIYAEIQSYAIELKNQGILLCLCSKNNEKDIVEVIDRHPDMIIRNNDIVIKKINWNDKVSNIKEIASELNLGLDSFVFVDDSSFEVNLVKKELPQVTVYQVPENIFLYPEMFKQLKLLFYTFNKTEEDKRRSSIYIEQSKRESEKHKFTDIDQYLESLNILLNIEINSIPNVARIAQMTQKTNQFNLTTIRYTENEIINMIKDSKYDIISINVSDKYGDNGITGLVILNYIEDKFAVIDTFLMSCRIIGRNIEYKIIDFIVNLVSNRNFEKLYSTYLQTNKNEQVRLFYENCGFSILEETKDIKKYFLDLKKYTKSKINYIKIEYGRKN